MPQFYERRGGEAVEEPDGNAKVLDERREVGGRREQN